MARKNSTKQTKKPKQTTKKKAATRVHAVKDRLFETDSTYLLKLVIVLILGAIWLRLDAPVNWLGVPLGAFPVGVGVGLLLIKLAETHQSNRKIGYAVLLLVGVISYFSDSGIVI